MDRTTNEDMSDMKTVKVRRVIEYDIHIPSEAPESDALEEARLRTTSEATRERFETGVSFEESAEAETVEFNGSDSSYSTRPVESPDELDLRDLVVFRSDNTEGRVTEITSRSVKITNLYTGKATSFVRRTGKEWGGDSHIRDVLVQKAA